MNEPLARIAAIARKEFRQLRRDHLTFGMVVGMPLLQILLFGYAINTDVRHLRAAVADQAGTQRSRALVADAEASQVVDIVAWVGDAEAIEELLQRGKITVGIFIPRDFERRAEDPHRAAAQLLIDGADPVVLGAAQSLARLPLIGRKHQNPNAGRSSTFEVRPYYNPERRSVVQIMPALIGVILTMTMVLFTAMALVRERERGNLELLIMTPVQTVELMAGKIIPYILIGLIQVTLILLVGEFVFEVPVRGSLFAAYTAGLVFISASLSVGLLVSTFAQNQFQAMQMTFFFFLPSILLSGFMFPFEGMPRAAQWLGELLPLTHFVRLFRGILLRAATLDQLALEFPPLLAFMAVSLGVAVLRFRKRLD